MNQIIRSCVRRATFTLALAFGLLIPQALLANGGGYENQGIVGQGGLMGFEPENTEHVQMLTESLIIHLGMESARVNITYELVNHSEQKQSVRFGFPIEESKGSGFMAALRGDEISGQINPERFTSLDDLKHFRNYQVQADQQALEVSFEGQTRVVDARRDGIEGWAISSLEFEPKQKRVLSISYECEYFDSSYGVSNDSFQSAPLFHYRLSTAAVWKGAIEQGRIEIHPDGIDPNWPRITEPAGRFKKQGQVWIWEFENLEPQMSDDFSVEVYPEFNLFYRNFADNEEDENDEESPFVGFVQQQENWSMIHQNYAVKASSTLPPDESGKKSYQAENLKEWWNSGEVWSEGAEGAGVGEWLEIEPEIAKPLQSIRIWPGYQKATHEDINLYQANARPRLTKVILNGEHEFEWEIPDREEEVVIPVVDYDKAVESVRLEFLSVYPGTRWEDLCISALQLEAKLENKPYISPQR